MIHGDKVPAARFGLETVSWSGMLGTGLSTIDSKLLISCMVDRCKAEGTEDRFWEVVVWSLRALVEGKFPLRDWQGRQWAPGSQQDQMKGSPLAG
eukprot:13736626-Alexandrium_andersonii.AAC.1